MSSSIGKGTVCNGSDVVCRNERNAACACGSNDDILVADCREELLF